MPNFIQSIVSLTSLVIRYQLNGSSLYNPPNVKQLAKTDQYSQRIEHSDNFKQLPYFKQSMQAVQEFVQTLTNFFEYEIYCVRMTNPFRHKILSDYFENADHTSLPKHGYKHNKAEDYEAFSFSQEMNGLNVHVTLDLGEHSKILNFQQFQDTINGQRVLLNSIIHDMMQLNIEAYSILLDVSSCQMRALTLMILIC